MPFKLQNCWATGCLRKAELLTGLLTRGSYPPFLQRHSYNSLFMDKLAKVDRCFLYRTIKSAITL